MTAGPGIDPVRFLNEQLAQASPDLMRDLLTTFVNALLSAQADVVYGAGYGERSSERVNSRNGYRRRDLDLDTRVGTLDVAVPKLHTGSLYPDWLMERRKRAERARWRPATCYLLGVSTRSPVRAGRPLVRLVGRGAVGRPRIQDVCCRLVARGDDHQGRRRESPRGQTCRRHARS